MREDRQNEKTRKQVGKRGGSIILNKEHTTNMKCLEEHIQPGSLVDEDQ